MALAANIVVCAASLRLRLRRPSLQSPYLLFPTCSTRGSEKTVPVGGRQGGFLKECAKQARRFRG